MLDVRLSPSVCASTLLLCASLLAQQDDTLRPVTHAGDLAEQAPVPTASDGGATDLDALRHDLSDDAVIAIHTADDDPDGGAYGIWGAGSRYKASFHDGFKFVPYLGGGYPHNQQLGWRTVAVTVGGEPLPLAARPGTWHDDHRFEYRHGSVTEAYDLRADGVEQTFVIASRPATDGDLVVSGALSTDLTADLLPDRHASLAFRDDRGNTLIHYGAATALDAAGRSLPLTTSYDGQRIHLRVPGRWLAEASYPLIIDPLLTRECVAFWNSSNPAPVDGVVLTTDIGRDDIANQTMVAYTRQTSATDSDLWVILFDSDDATFANRHQVFSDLSSSWGNSSPAVAFAGGAADRWIVAFMRLRVGGGGTQNGLRYHLHASNDLTANTSVTAVNRPNGSSHGTVVDAGGVQSLSSGPSVFLVYERTDPGSNSEVFGKPIDLSTNSQGAEVLVDTSPVGTDHIRTRPSINQVAQSGTDGWVVAFQEYWVSRPGGSDDWDINLRRIDGSGTPVGRARSPSNSTPDTTHQLTPIVSGANDQYSLAMAIWAETPLTATSTDVGTDIFNETFSWTTGYSFAFGEIAELTLGLVSDRRWRVTDGTHDTNTDSHWVWTFESTLSGSQYACSSGYDAGRIERLVAYNPPGTPKAFAGSVTFNDDRNEFVLSYASDEDGVPCGSGSSNNHTVYTQRMTHLPEPAETRYGVGCGSGTIGWSGRNLAGIRDYSITLSGATPSVPAVLYLNLSSGNLPLDGFAMQGCVLNLNPFNLISIPAATSATGSAAFTTGIPTNPNLVCGDLFWQWAYVSPGLNSLGIAWTQGLNTTFACP